MTDIEVPPENKELLGAKVLRAVKVLSSGNPDDDEAERQELLKNPKKALKNLVKMSANHKIQVEEAKPNETRMVLPSTADLKRTLEDMKNGLFNYPNEYSKDSATYIDPKEQPERALSFLLGDYILKKCK